MKILTSALQLARPNANDGALRQHSPPKLRCRTYISPHAPVVGTRSYGLSSACRPFRTYVEFHSFQSPHSGPSPSHSPVICNSANGAECTNASDGPVVLTRESGKNEKLRSRLVALGLECLEVPLIEHREGPDAALLPKLLKDESFEWILITSPEAAAVFSRAWRQAGSPGVSLAVVGAGTGQALEDKNIRVAFTPSKATARVLSAELPLPRGADTRVLYPSSIKAGSDLEQGLLTRGVSVQRINTYSTDSVASISPQLLQRALSAPVVTFASPTAVRSWVRLVGDVRGWGGAAACIGMTSAQVAEEVGMARVFYPESPGMDGWVESILEALQSKAPNQSLPAR